MIRSAPLFTGAALAALGCAGDVLAGDSPHQFSANVAITTDYRFRGISQTSEDPAVQGGFDYAYGPLGFYAGVWASSLDFNVPDPDPADVEIDFYAGLAGRFGGGLDWDAGVLYYAYPGSDTGPGAADYDYVEVYGSLGYDFGPLALTGGLNYSPDYFFESGDFLYLYGELEVPLVHGLVMAAHLGRNEIDDNAQFGTPDYSDWSIGVSRTFGAFTLDLSYVDTDLGESECFGGTPVCDAAAVFTVSAAW